jgi:hypothetical protein
MAVLEEERREEWMVTEIGGRSKNMLADFYIRHCGAPNKILMPPGSKLWLRHCYQPV